MTWNSWDTAENVIEQTSTSYTGVITLKNITLQNGTNGLLINSATKVVIDNCKALNNGYNNTNFSTVLPSSGSRLGYDSTPAELQNFYPSSVPIVFTGLKTFQSEKCYNSSLHYCSNWGLMRSKLESVHRAHTHADRLRVSKLGRVVFPVLKISIPVLKIPFPDLKINFELLLKN